MSSGSITTGRTSGLLTLAIGALFYSSGSIARPDLQPLGPDIADKGSAFYHFTQRQYDSADGERHYRVWTAVPDKAPPAAGYPVLYMLDGNAVMDKLDDAFLQQLFAGSPPVIVAIGYQTALPFDTAARARDYTPPLKTHEPRAGKPALPPRKTGGNDAFRQLLTETMVPQTEANLKIDPPPARYLGPLLRRIVCARRVEEGFAVRDLLFRQPVARSGPAIAFAGKPKS